MSNRFSVRNTEKEINEDTLDDLFEDDAEDTPVQSKQPVQLEERRRKLDMENASDIEEVIEEEIVVEEVQSQGRDLRNESMEEKLARVSKPKVKESWKPSAEALAELPELQSSNPVYDADEFIKNNTGPVMLIDNAEEQYRNDISQATDVLDKASKNIEYFKHRHGIAKIDIPDERFHMEIMNAASDPNIESAQAGLDKVIDDMLKIHPTSVYFFATEDDENDPDIIDVADMVPPEQRVVEPADASPNTAGVRAAAPVSSITDVEVVIDKSQEDEVQFTPEEKAKMIQSDVIKLNIVQDQNIPLSEIEDVDLSAIKSVMSQYTRKIGDLDTALPASRYRATFCGLSYRESLDMLAIDSLNNLDAERYKWTVVFNHMYNMSIGDWEEYRYYKDRQGKIVRLNENEPVPVGVNATDVQVHSKFDDFLSKTSYIDLEYMLWKILCATNNDTETMSITCNNIIGTDSDGEDVQCGYEYDQKYVPAKLLLNENVDEAILQEMNRTANADTTKDIMENFNDGPVMNTHLLQLPDSGYQLIYGHLSAYDYLNSVYGKIQEYVSQYQMGDLTQDQASIRLLMIELIKVVKGFLVPKSNGEGWYRITGMENILTIIDTLSSTDWKVIAKLTTKITNPYIMDFKVSRSTCPKCGYTHDVSITDMARLLFFMAQRLLFQGIEF